MHYYLCDWEQINDVDGLPSWQPTVATALPVGVSWSCIDLRPDPTAATGYALLACAVRPAADPAGAEYLGENLDASPNTPNRRGIESRLGLPRDALSGTYREIIAAILTQWGTEDGIRWKPLKRILNASNPNEWEIFLGGELIWSQGR